MVYTQYTNSFRVVPDTAFPDLAARLSRCDCGWLCYNHGLMRHVILLLLFLAILLALPAMAQVERDPASRHSSNSTVSPFLPDDLHAQKATPAPPDPAALLAHAARQAGRSISDTARLAPAIELTQLAEAAAQIAAGAAAAESVPEEAPAPDLPQPAPKLDLADDPEPPAAEHGPAAAHQTTTATEAEAYPPVRPLRDTPETADEPPAAPEPEPAEEPDTELPDSPPAVTETAAAEAPAAEPAAELEPAAEEQALEPPAGPAGGKRLIPDRRRKADETLLSRDGSLEGVQRNQPEPAQTPTPGAPRLDPPAPAAGLPDPAAASQPQGGTSLADLTGSPAPPDPLSGESSPIVQFSAMTPSSGLTPAAANPEQPAAGFIAPYPGASAPVDLALPAGLPQMPGFDVPASMKVLSRGNPKKKLVALTFDDGPHPEYTSQLLAVLDYYDVPATFFCVGVQVQKYPQWVKMMSQQGHEVANHTYDHFRLPKLPKSEKEYQIDEYQRLIEALTGVTPRFLRPPGGQDDKETQQMLAQRRMVMALWDVAINDTSHGKLEQELLDVSLKKVRPGSVLLAHDGVQATIDMLPDLIDKLRAQGYEFVTLSELAARK